jgi:predicted nuclease of predicted toxin-antitoxin system
VKFKLHENLPASSAAVLARAGHDVDTVTAEGLTGAPDRDVVVAATAEGRILISLDVGMGDIRAYPPGSHARSCAARPAQRGARPRPRPCSRRQA